MRPHLTSPNRTGAVQIPQHVMGAWTRIHQKRDLIQKAYECPTMTQHELGARAKAAFKLKRAPAQTTISDILRKAPAIMSDAYGDGKREVVGVDPAVEDQNVCLSRELIKTKAQDLQKELCDTWELNFSNGWLSGFQRRHALRYRKRHGEAASADTAAVYLGRQQLQDLTDQYAPTISAHGVKKTKTRITIALTANADGSDALPPLFLGRAKQPYCFTKRTASQLGFEYKANQKAWMTGQVFREWLLNLDRDMRAAGRHILLLVDKVLPPNTTAFLQPMDAGIIAEFKRAYRRKQLRWVYEKIKRAELIKKGDVYKVDQLQAMKWSKEIWQELQGKTTIENCFRHTGIVFNGVYERSKK
ncbi:hypothetical protein PHYSODRAFT_323385 [Phytophthora sojae]|uniref:HTH CENPB-type domain-containing protein n=1 Tax=Phytophthora sojae (strain P6497) TaxID=1094619 RepID=G4YJI0_PHYSP|nr:hypothetical protein PHYSODRAFT_323385 [Phytophthora sojae]EGZ29935.1 hypothetical protein PHYSODRAFT_323385 [Phytophthora sojae]|eukprot:XP_009517210.1 hypothetical protein PHYSODRAFT_323385 [Phytophthora sojae]